MTPQRVFFGKLPLTTLKFREKKTNVGVAACVGVRVLAAWVSARVCGCGCWRGVRACGVWVFEFLVFTKKQKTQKLTTMKFKILNKRKKMKKKKKERKKTQKTKKLKKKLKK